MTGKQIINEIFSKKANTIQQPIFSYSKTDTVINRNDGKQLVIGKNIKITGDIDVCDSLVVEGHLEANIKNARALDIVHGGVFKGEASIEEAHISGLFDGILNITGTLYVYSTGVLNGKVHYNSIVIEKGGIINGTLKPIKIKNISQVKSKEEIEDIESKQNFAKK